MTPAREDPGPGEAREEDVRRALDALDRHPNRCAARDWPCSLAGLEQPGLYSWWVDEPGAHELSTGLGERVDSGRIYAGQAGARRGQTANESTIRSRIRGNHLGGSIRGSTFRLTLAAALFRPLDLRLVRPRRLERPSEHRLTDWMHSHLEVAVFPFAGREALRDLEDQVLDRLDPPLNLEGRPATALRAGLGLARARLSRPEATAAPAAGSEHEDPDAAGAGECPFCARLEEEDLLGASQHAAAFLDAYPVSKGHALVVSRRHEVSFFSLPEEEQAAMWALAGEVRKNLDGTLRPDGYNVGLNAGAPAGQTVTHAHLHVIPRYEGDTDDPRGGVRWVLPGTTD